jgi:hypothetical protein
MSVKVVLTLVVSPLLVLFFLARMLVALPFLVGWMGLFLTGQGDSETADRLSDICDRILGLPR